MHCVARVDPESLIERRRRLVRLECRGGGLIDGYILHEFPNGRLLVDLATGWCPVRREPAPAAALVPEGVEVLTEGPVGGSQCRYGRLPKNARRRCCREEDGHPKHDWLR